MNVDVNGTLWATGCVIGSVVGTWTTTDVDTMGIADATSARSARLLSKSAL
jgi:hypothetical protein